jgi:hypothetical protein
MGKGGQLEAVRLFYALMLLKKRRMATVMAHPPGLADGSTHKSSQGRSPQRTPDTTSFVRRLTPPDFSEGCEPALFEISRFDVIRFQRGFLLGPYPRFGTLQLVEQADGTGTTAETSLGRESSPFIHAVFVMKNRRFRGADVAVSRGIETHRIECRERYFFTHKAPRDVFSIPFPCPALLHQTPVVK